MSLIDFDPTWEIFGQWTAKDYDLQYRAEFLGDTPSAQFSLGKGEKPYRRLRSYVLCGSNLLIVSHRAAGVPVHFQKEKLVPVSTLSLRTEIVLSEKRSIMDPIGFPKASARGERFFAKASESETGEESQAFVLLYPDDLNFIRWKDAVAFSNRLKEIIAEAN